MTCETVTPSDTPEPVLGAVRAYMAPVVHHKRRARRERPRAEGWPELVLLIDTETSIDAAQWLRFGSYRLCRWVQDGAGYWRLVCIEEGLFYGDDLPERCPGDFRALEAYVRRAFADTPDLNASRLPRYSRRNFVDKVLWRAVAQGRALICGFNLPFDLSRLAVSWGETRPRDAARRFARGFSFQLWDWRNPKTTRREEHPFRPRLLIRHEDSKRARFAWGTCQGTEMIEGTGRHRKRYTGHFLDLKTLAYALTGESHSLATAANAFDMPHEKHSADYAGPITSQYIAYNRQDLRVTQTLLEALRAEFDLHPIDADPWQLRSSASLAKGYLRAAGITPLRTRANDVPDWVVGAAMEAYFGGRTECHLPRMPVPVVYTDFLSMYPTVHTLTHMCEWLTARSLHARVCTTDARRVLNTVSVERCLAPALWPDLRFFALVDPKDDALPLRAQYDPSSEGFSIGVNRVTSRTPLWYTGFDLAASVLLTSRIPYIRRAVTIRANGKAETLRTVKLRGQVDLDPRRGDIFRAVVELRNRVKQDAALPKEGKKRLGDALKALANGGSYGILAEMNPQDLPEGETQDVRVIGGSQRFTTKSTKPEQAGEYSFPPIAALVTGAARLLLALLERLVRDAGGSYALCDTDSLAIVASESGGFLPCPCPAGSETGPTGEPGARVLSWAQVREIGARVDVLKPYGPDVLDSLLKIEDVNFRNGQQVQLYAYGLSAKRYCLFVEGPNGPDIVKASEHGLGHLLNPTDPEDANRGASGAPKWIEEVWRGLVLQNRGQQPPQFPSWFARPAVARHGFTSPALIRSLHRGQGNRPYCEQVKPFNFALTCYVTPDGAPAGIDPATCHLIAPFERDARKWVNQDWFDTASRTVCRVTSRATTSRRVARVKSVADIVADYAAHTEAKSAGPTGEPTGPATAGLVQRRHVEPVYLFRIGKESNRLEEVEQGQVRTLEEVQEIFEHPVRTAWDEICLPLLATIPARQLEAETGIRESLLIRYRKGLVRPSARQLKRLIGALRFHLPELARSCVGSDNKAVGDPLHFARKLSVSRAPQCPTGSSVLIGR